MNGIIGKFLSIPHTTGARGAISLIEAAAHIATIWTPAHYHDSIKGTAGALEKVAFAYGLVMAGDAGRAKKDLEEAKQDVAASIQTGNTDRLFRKDLPITPEAPKTGI